MFDKIQKIEEKFRTIESQIAEPEIISQPDKYRELIKEYNSLSPLMEKYHSYLHTEKSIQDAMDMLPEAKDDEIRDMINEELKNYRAQLETLKNEIQVLLLPKDPMDDKNVIVEIRAGTGGEEAALFAGVLYRMYSMYAEKAGFSINVLNENETELGGYKEIEFMVEGSGAYSQFKFESGVHRVQRVPETESQGRIQTSTATVAVLPEVDEVTIEIRPEDLVIETCKSSGAGGQHINKTESAVRILHKPTGIVTWCQNERSQLKNKDKALKMLRSKLFEIEQTKQNELIDSTRKNQVGTGMRSEKIRTYNYPQGRVTDHRIGLSLFNLEGFVNGNIQEMIDALRTADTADKLKENASNQ